MDENDHWIFLAELRFSPVGQSQPWMLKPSFVHSRLSALPHVADNAELLLVSWRHSPIGPTQISGGVSNVLRSALRMLPVFGNGKVRKIPERVKSLCAFPDCAHRIVRQRQFGDRAAATHYLGEKDAIRR